MNLEIIELTLSPIQQNTRLIVANKKVLVIDPAGDAEVILSLVEKKGFTIEAIWLTHSHLDHCGGVLDLLKAYPKAKLLGHPEEKFFRQNVENICLSYGIPPGSMKNCPEPTEYINGGETLDFEGISFQVLFTPGHSPGHVAFYQGDSGVLLGGDTLFSGSIGRTDLPGGNHEVLLQSITEKIFTLPDETRVLSGHGPETTVGKEKRSNPFF